MRFTLCILLLACPAIVRAAEPGVAPISIHPDNPRYFLFRGKPLVLITATEHYGSVINRPFDFEKYLVDHAEKRQTLTRTFLLFRETQTAKNPYSPCKPETPDYIAPWPRTGLERALDLEPKYDLDKWNPEFFDRLHRFLRRASELGVVVELTIFSNLYNQQILDMSPLCASNNIQGIGPKHVARFTTLQDPKLTERQLAFARKVVQETARYDNVYYEVCNEPAGDIPPETTVAEVDAWQAAIAKAVREETKKLGTNHMVFVCPVVAVKPSVVQVFDGAIKDDTYDAINFHTHGALILGGKTYNIGGFMTKELSLGGLAAFCTAMRESGVRKPFALDEDNAASAYKDEEAWTIERKRAWVTVMNGGHYDFIDFSITVGNETGTPESNRKIRTWMKNVSTFVHSFDVIGAKPQAAWVQGLPGHVFQSALAVSGEDYIA
jgi:hypothetical protein